MNIELKTKINNYYEKAIKNEDTKKVACDLIYDLTRENLNLEHSLDILANNINETHIDEKEENNNETFDYNKFMNPIDCSSEYTCKNKGILCEECLRNEARIFKDYFKL